MAKFVIDDKEKTIKQLIQCYECAYYRTIKYNCWDICELHDKPMLEDDYCSKAKRSDRDERKDY